MALVQGNLSPLRQCTKLLCTFKLTAEFAQSARQPWGRGFQMTALRAQLCMLMLLLQPFFAISQNVRSNAEVYICPGLSLNELESALQTELPAKSDRCPCISEKDRIMVPEGTKLLLLCVSTDKRRESDTCWWDPGEGNKYGSKTEGKIIEGNVKLREDKRCSFGDHINTSEDLVRFAWYLEVPKGHLNLNSTHWACSIHKRSGSITHDFSPPLDVKPRCEMHQDCNATGEICDSHAHYCRQPCDGGNGGTAECRTISEHAICSPNQSSAVQYSCTCSQATVPIYTAQGNLTDCLQSCKSHTECTPDKKCVMPSSTACEGSYNQKCSSMRCVDVCRDFPCGSKQTCRASSSHQAECVCSSSEFIALPDGTNCVNPYLHKKELNIQLQLKGRSPESLDNFKDYTSELSRADDGFNYENFILYRNETVRITCSLEGGYPSPTVSWNTRPTISPPGLLKEEFWLSDYMQKPSSDGPDYAKNAHAAIVLGNLKSWHSESKSVLLSCKGNHKTLKDQEDLQERSVKLVIKDCRLDEECPKNKACNLEECQDVCHVANALNNGNACPGNNEECMPSKAHKYSCNCKRGFGRLSPGSQCLKKCSNLTDCKISQGETCFKGLCSKVCTAYPCGHGTTCQQDNKGGRSCMCKNGVYHYDDTSCFPAVKAYSKHLRVRIGNQDLKCHIEGNSVYCKMWKAEHGNSGWKIRIFFDHLFPQPRVEFLPGKTNLQSSVPNESAQVAQTVRTIQKSAIKLDYTLTFTIKAAYADHGKSLEARISPILGEKISLAIDLNISDCKIDDDCLQDQVCAVSNVDNQNKCLNVCSEEQKSGRPNCPQHSECSPRTEEAHKWHCKCNAGRVLVTLQGKQQCPWTCSENKNCQDPFKTCQLWNDRNWTRNQSVCLPTCHNVHCGPSTRCEAVEKHAFKCHCEEGFFADNGENSVQGRKINCYRPVAPNPDVPRISMQLGLLKEVDLCPNEPRESMAASTCSMFFVAENANISLKCHLERLFPAPENVIWEIVDNMDQVVQSVSSATNYASSSNMARNSWSSKIWEESGLRQSSVGASQHVFDGPRSYVRSFFSEINLLIIGRNALDGRKVRCSVPHESLMNRMYSTTTTPAHFFGCSQHGCGRVDVFSVPKNPVTIGSKAELKCKTDLPLLQHGSEGNDKPDCTWTMKWTNMTAAKMAISISFFSWNRTIENATKISPEQVNLQEVVRDEPKTDCSIILNNITMDLGGYWTCSATLFNGFKVDSRNQQDGALLYDFAPPAKVLVDLMHMEGNEFKDAAFNVSSLDPGNILGTTRLRRKQVDSTKIRNVKLTFNCTAYQTHPPPMFEWAIHSHRKNVLTGNRLKEEYISTPGVEVIGEPPTISSLLPVGSLIGGKSWLTSTVSNNDELGPTLKTYISNFTHTFEVFNEQWEPILSEVDVICKVVHRNRDQRGPSVSLTKWIDSIIINFHGIHGPSQLQDMKMDPDVKVDAIVIGLSFIILALLVVSSILFMIIKRQRGNAENGQTPAWNGYEWSCCSKSGRNPTTVHVTNMEAAAHPCYAESGQGDSAAVAVRCIGNQQPITSKIPDDSGYMELPPHRQIKIDTGDSVHPASSSSCSARVNIEGNNAVAPGNIYEEIRE